MSFITTSTSDSYTGNENANRAIPHGLGTTPTAVLFSMNGTGYFIRIIKSGVVEFIADTSHTDFVVTAMDNINFYVGNVTNWSQSGNGSSYTYTWTAIK